MKIQCKVCGSIIGSYSLEYHIKRHNLSIDEYAEKFEEKRICENINCENILKPNQEKFCSRSCSAKSHVKLAQEACTGDKHWLKNLDNPKYAESEEKRKKKIGKTFREMAENGEHPCFKEEVKQKIKDTMAKGFANGEYKHSTKEFSDKARDRELEKFKNGIHTFQVKSKEIHEKAKLTWIKKYGVDNPMKSKVVSSKNCGELHHNWKGGYIGNFGSNWDEIREFILWRDNYECLICKTKNNLHVHHMIRRREAIELGLDVDVVNDPIYLITLCNSHHLIQEWNKTYDEKICSYLNNWFHNSQGGLISWERNNNTKFCIPRL